MKLPDGVAVGAPRAVRRRPDTGPGVGAERVAELSAQQDVLVMPGTDFQTRDDGAMRVNVGNLGLVDRLGAFGAQA